ncbi:asb040 [Agrotis segetum nucleopolyhedrovirus B]|uniref:Asb040 n=1 Tax=Agrotis segetum nucleopolyhedrovirus B TaxID=1580580 RepID=A0A0A7KR61_9ABAC|nr:asb040 [Agrotis segetum nucleopolyhedrovirus B]AIZ48598.1 asb040 [Agrotis segetum nucleopolyhedrovirus B]
MEQFELVLNENDFGDNWNKCRVDKFAACHFVLLRSASIKLMLISRLASVLITAILIVAALYNASNLSDFMLYYSHWSLLLLMCMFMSASTTSLLVDGLERNNRYHIPSYVILHRVLYNVACPANILSSIVYAIITFTYVSSTKSSINHVVHSINSLLVIMEVTLNAIPLRLHHVYQPLLYTLSYAAFSATYRYYTGRDIYRCLQWDDQQEMSKMCIGFMVLLFVVYIVLYMVSFIKMKCSSL